MGLMTSAFQIWLGAMVLSTMILALLIINLFKNDNILSKLFIGFFVICLLFINSNFIWNYYPLTADAVMYHRVMSQVAAKFGSGFWGNPAQVLIRNPAYTVPGGFLYYLLGPSELIGRLLSTIMGIGIIYNIYQIGLVLYDRRVAILGAVFFVFFPYFMILSCLLIRDMMIAYLITLFFLLLFKFQQDVNNSYRIKYGILIFGDLIYLGLLRPPLLMILVLSLIVFLIIGYNRKGPRRFLHNLPKITLTILIIAVMGIGYPSLKRSIMRGESRLLEGEYYTQVEVMDLRLGATEHAGSYYMQGVHYRNYKDVIKYMPMATAYFLFSPFPWQIRSMKQSLGLIDSLGITVIFCFFIKGLRDTYRRYPKFVIPLLIFLIIGCGFSGVLQANYGAAMRHRTMFVYLMFPIAAHGFLSSRRKKDVNTKHFQARI